MLLIVGLCLLGALLALLAAAGVAWAGWWSPTARIRRIRRAGERAMADLDELAVGLRVAQRTERWSRSRR